MERGEERRIRAGERAATCWQMGEACYVLEDWSPLLPVALFGLNQAERAGRPDLTARAQIGVGLITGIAGRSPLGLDRTGHLDRARSTSAALGREVPW